MADGVPILGNGSGESMKLLKAQTEILFQMVQVVDQMFQFQVRVALGWSPEAAVADMKLNVPPPPKTGSSVPGAGWGRNGG